MLIRVPLWLSLCLTSGLISAVCAAPADAAQFVLSNEEHAVELTQDAAEAIAPFPPMQQVIHLEARVSTQLSRSSSPPIIDLSDKTLFQIINDTLHDADAPYHHPSHPERAHPPLHKFARFLNFTQDDKLFKLLDDPHATLSLLAPDDRALTRRPHPPHHHHGPPHAEAAASDFWHDSVEAGEGDVEERSSLFQDQAPHAIDDLVEEVLNWDESVNAEADKTRREKIQHLVSLIIRYHTLDKQYIGRDLADKATAATALGEDFRVHVDPALSPFALRFNFLSETRGPVIKAKNGYIYLLNAPLLIPLTPLQTLFVLPSFFSTLTSGLQKVHVNVSTFAPHHHEHDSEEAGDVSPVVAEMLQQLVSEIPEGTHWTVFAPVNLAFARLGLKANAFLFSPFGRQVLKDILSYHIVKDVIFFSDHVHNITSGKSMLQAADSSEVEATYNQRSYDLTTQFNETALPVRVYEYRPFGRGPLKRDIWVGDKSEAPVPVVIKDGPAIKGAYHVIPRLLIPPQYRHHERYSMLLQEHPEDMAHSPFPFGQPHGRPHGPPHRGPRFPGRDGPPHHEPPHFPGRPGPPHHEAPARPRGPPPARRGRALAGRRARD